MKKVNPAYFLFLLLVPISIVYYIFLVLRKKKTTPFVSLKSNERTIEIVDTHLMPNGLNPRQMDLIKYLEIQTEGKVSDLVKTFGTTDRTLRRDFNKLENLGLVKKSGSTKSASYRLVK